MPHNPTEIFMPPGTKSGEQQELRDLRAADDARKDGAREYQRNRRATRKKMLDLGLHEISNVRLAAMLAKTSSRVLNHDGTIELVENKWDGPLRAAIRMEQRRRAGGHPLGWPKVYSHGKGDKK
jgi:hypothetical protein